MDDTKGDNGGLAKDSDGHCKCCFDLDVTLAIDSSNKRAIRVDPNDQIVSIRRDAHLIVKSAASGCQLCSVILKALAFFGWDARNEADKISLRFPMGNGTFELQFKLGESGVYVQLFAPLYCEKVWKGIRRLPDICTDQLCIDSIAFVRSCLMICRQGHQICHRHGYKLPSRLLDIGDMYQQVVRLVETEAMENPEYIALSYCWGKSTPMRTTLDTLDTMKDGIHVSTLTIAYSDAVNLAHQLGVRYLWIDALCIIQDCHQDWEKESSKMGDIYANALLTVAASSSKSADEGFLRLFYRNDPSSAKASTTTFAEVINIGADQYAIFARTIPQEGVHWRWQEEAEQRQLRQPLSQRGWTLQEQLLSSRFLSVSNKELQWTCHEAVLCECTSRLNHRREFGHMPISQITQPGQALHFWHKVIENYSKRLLTRPEDKLPAISAVAGVLQQKTDFKYAAGLWVENIDLDLLWRTTGALRTLPNCAFIAPSFSWASVDGEIDYYCFRNGKDPYQASAKVLAVEVDASPNAPLGRVESGRLTICGALISGHLRYIDTEGGELVVRLGRIQLEASADTMLQEVMVPGPNGSSVRTACRWNPWKMDQNQSDVAHGAVNTTAEEANSRDRNAAPVQGRFDPATECWALRLGSFSMTENRQEHELMILGKSPTEPDVYQRLGLGSCEDDGKVKLFETEQVTTITLG